MMLDDENDEDMDEEYADEIIREINHSFKIYCQWFQIMESKKWLFYFFTSDYILIDKILKINLKWWRTYLFIFAELNKKISSI